MSKVYVKIDRNGCITDVASSAFLSDTAGWTEIDEGEGGRYYHAQGNYLPGPVADENGLYNYKYENGAVAGRSVEEKAAELAARPPAPPTVQELLTNAALSAQYARCEWDGIKYVADPKNPIPLVLPMPVIRNMIYLHNGVKYVALLNGTATEAAFGEYFTEYEL